MAVTPKNIERKIEETIISMLEAESFVITNSIPVLPWYDVDTDVKGKQIIVHVNPAMPGITDENGEAGDWEVNIDLLAYYHIKENEITGGSNTIYEFLLGWFIQTTKSALQTALGTLTVNGKWNGISQENYDERFFQKAGTITLAIQ